MTWILQKIFESGKLGISQTSLRLDGADRRSIKRFACQIGANQVSPKTNEGKGTAEFKETNAVNWLNTNFGKEMFPPV